jgi:hypothetical protein
VVPQDFANITNKMTLYEAMEHQFISKLNLPLCRTGACAVF